MDREPISNRYRMDTEQIQNRYGKDTERIKIRNGNECGMATECEVLSTVAC